MAALNLKWIRVHVDANGIKSEKIYPKTKSGQSQATKYVAEFYDQQKKHPWFYLIKKISDLEREKKWAGYKRTKIIDKKLKELYADRKSFIEMTEVGFPGEIKINILTD